MVAWHGRRALNRGPTLAPRSERLAARALRARRAAGAAERLPLSLAEPRVRLRRLGCACLICLPGLRTVPGIRFLSLEFGICFWGVSGVSSPPEEKCALWETTVLQHCTAALYCSTAALLRTVLQRALYSAAVGCGAVQPVHAAPHHGSNLRAFTNVYDCPVFALFVLPTPESPSFTSPAQR